MGNWLVNHNNQQNIPVIMKPNPMCSRELDDPSYNAKRIAGVLALSSKTGVHVVPIRWHEFSLFLSFSLKGVRAMGSVWHDKD